MTVAIDPVLASALAACRVPGVLVGHRVISAGDELALLPQEAGAFASSVAKVKQASAAARIAARQLLARLGHSAVPIPKAAGGAPVWPPGVAGSLSHDSRVAVAAVGYSHEVAALGIDIEPAECLPPDVLDLVATPKERRAIGDDPYRGRLLFIAKEAVYKAVYPLDRMFLEHHDIEIDLAHRRAVVCNGRVVNLKFCISTHLVALAFIPAPACSS